MNGQRARAIPAKSLSEYRGAPTAEHGCSERRGVWGAISGPPIFLHGERLELQAPEQPCAVLVEPLPRGIVAEPKRRATGLEAHRGPEEGRLRQRGLDQEELGPRVLHSQRREAQLEQVLAVDPAGRLHDRVEAPAAQRDGGL